ncbi:oligoendopeptidase F [Mycoplasma corogypsi]|uniref:oligoendopeptidase F n=1 Tax=Mycoplasma corogypsi TaxID=2106 RepID=UPI003872FA8C
MKINEYDKYLDIPEKYRFDLESILEGKTLEQLIAEYQKLTEQRISNKDTKYNDIEAYVADVKLSEQASLIMFKIHNYISNNLNTNLVDPKWKKIKQDFSFLSNELSQKLGSESNRFYKHIDKMKLWKEDPRLKSYKRHMEDQINALEHKLSDEVEEYIINSAIGAGKPHSIFSIITNSELQFNDVLTSKGKKLKLNYANRDMLLKSNDPLVRKNAYQNFWNAYYQHKDSLSEILYQQFIAITTEAKLRKYPSAVAMLTDSDKVSDDILVSLFEQVSNNRDPLIKYHKLHKKFYKIRYGSKQQKWDGMRELVDVKSQYSVEEAQQLILEALKPFGAEYIDQIQKAFNQRWVDYMPSKGKRQGAYSIGTSYGIDKKFILMNFNGELRSVETLAHELGHSMHSYFSDTRQNFIDSQYPIFLAEIASIYNELMLFDLLLKTSTDDKLKFHILESMIKGFQGTVLRQVEWANYEYSLYDKISKGQISSSYSALSELYYENSKKFTLNPTELKYNDKDTLGAIYVPHFYYGFYVYKYAIGQLVACYFFKKYKTEGVVAIQNYIENFLSAGGSDYPINILNKVGIDLTSEQFYQEGFSYIKELVYEYEKLGNKLFKTKK